MEPTRERTRCEIAITVEDTGIGIAPETLPSLFSEFEQAEAAVRRRQGGTGLGLAISRRLARAMGGDILVVEHAGRRLDVHGHAAAQAGAKAAQRRSPARRAARHRQHVLLALDRAIERRALRLVARRRRHSRRGERDRRARPTWWRAAADGGRALHARSSSTAAAAARRRRGCWRARGQRRADGVQGVIVLDTAAKADFAQFRDAGFDAYLVRPVRPQSVLTHLGAGHEPSEPVPGRRRPERPVQFLHRALGAARRGQRHQRAAGAAHAREGRLQGAALRQRPRGGRCHRASAGRRGARPTTSC